MSSTIVKAEVAGRNTKTGELFLRVPWKNAHRGILVSDDVLPHGSKSATLIEVELRSWGYTPGGSYTADVEFIRDASPST